MKHEQFKYEFPRFTTKMLSAVAPQSNLVKGCFSLPSQKNESSSCAAAENIIEDHQPNLIMDVENWNVNNYSKSQTRQFCSVV